MILSASCSPGLEPILSRELKHYDIHEQTRNPGRISFKADANKVAELLINLRTADNLFYVVGEFPASNFDDLFDAVYALPWEEIIKKSDKLTIAKVRSRYSVINAQSTVQAMVQKAVYAKLCALYHMQRMPETGTDFHARIHLYNNICTVEIDLCGIPLSKRGYRRFPGLAPLKESLAAASLFNAGWKASMPLDDMFCGTGSIAIEAALYAMHRAPGARRTFAWEQFALYDGRSVRDVKEKALEQERKEPEFFITASDIDPVMIDQAKKNAKYAEIPLSDSPQKPGLYFTATDFQRRKPLQSKGYIITDPPYGNRLSNPLDAEKLYKTLHEHFTAMYGGFDISSFSDKEDFALLMQVQDARHVKITDGRETRWLIRWKQE